MVSLTSLPSQITSTSDIRLDQKFNSSESALLNNVGEELINTEKENSSNKNFQKDFKNIMSETIPNTHIENSSKNIEKSLEFNKKLPEKELSQFHSQSNFLNSNVTFESNLKNKEKIKKEFSNEDYLAITQLPLNLMQDRSDLKEAKIPLDVDLLKSKKDMSDYLTLLNSSSRKNTLDQLGADSEKEEFSLKNSSQALRSKKIANSDLKKLIEDKNLNKPLEIRFKEQNLDSLSFNNFKSESSEEPKQRPQVQSMLEDLTVSDSSRNPWNSEFLEVNNKKVTTVEKPKKYFFNSDSSSSLKDLGSHPIQQPYSHVTASQGEIKFHSQVNSGLSSDLFHFIQSAMSQMIKNSDENYVLQLNPKNLGEIKMELSHLNKDSSNSELILNIQSNNDQVRQFLVDHKEALVEVLRSYGDQIKVDVAQSSPSYIENFQKNLIDQQSDKRKNIWDVWAEYQMRNEA